MKKYYVNGKKISKAQAQEIQRQNNEYISSGDWNLIAKCQFITVIQ